jgi:hypothetical protein
MTMGRGGRDGNVGMVIEVQWIFLGWWMNNER